MAASLGGEGMGAATASRTRTVVISGLLVAIQLLLAVTGWGLIPFPTGTPATIFHVPTIIAGALEGPIVGLLVGLIFGVTSWMRTADPTFANPLVSIVPRLFIGVVAWAVFAGLRRYNLALAAAAAGILGTLTNTVLVLTMATRVSPELWPVERAWAVALTNAPGEVIIATIITTAVVLAVAGAGRARRSSV